MRIDLALVRLRFVKTRSRAQELAESGLVRCNGVRVQRGSHPLATGDVLTLPGSHGARVIEVVALPGSHGARVIEVVALPERRGPPAEARSHYRELDQSGETAIAGGEAPLSKGNLTP